MALRWRSSLDNFISPIPIVSTPSLLGIHLSLPLYSLYLISVYLPSRSGCTDDFKESLDQLDATLQILPPSANVIVMGDFNADIGAAGGPKASTSGENTPKISQSLELCVVSLTPEHHCRLIYL